MSILEMAVRAEIKQTLIKWGSIMGLILVAVVLTACGGDSGPEEPDALANSSKLRSYCETVIGKWDLCVERLDSGIRNAEVGNCINIAKTCSYTNEIMDQAIANVTAMGCNTYIQTLEDNLNSDLFGQGCTGF